MGFVVPEEFEFSSFDGTQVQAWIMRGQGCRSDRKCPLILSIHGGPHGTFGWSFNANFQAYAARMRGQLQLVLIGKTLLPIPKHPRIHHLGFLTDRQKFDAMAAAAVLIMPSYFESLSMVALEAWALGKPVLANGRCDVLKGQAIRSNAGLYYESYGEFAEALDAIVSTPSLAQTLGRNGAAYFTRHYAWPVIERKYLETLDRIAREGPASRPMDPLPGFFARRRSELPAARNVLSRIPSGPSLS